MEVDSVSPHLPPFCPCTRSSEVASDSESEHHQLRKVSKPKKHSDKCSQVSQTWALIIKGFKFYHLTSKKPSTGIPGKNLGEKKGTFGNLVLLSVYKDLKQEEKEKAEMKRQLSPDPIILEM